MNSEKPSKTALITGGSSGIGKAVVEKLIANGYKVINADIETPKKPAQNHFFKTCDVRKQEDVAALYTWAVENVGHPDFVILSAGIGIREKLTEGDPEKWKAVLDTNILGVLRCIRAFTPEMLRKKEGHVVFISSVAAGQPHPYGGIYAASKSAVDVIAETLRLESLPYINVSVISPGIVDTAFFKNQISGNNSVEKMNLGALSAASIAEDVWYALNKTNGNSINKIITRPLLQNF